MGEIVLSEHQLACRAAHERVQYLRHLYRDILDGRIEYGLAGIDLQARVQELQEYQRLLSGKLKELELLPMRPDPEKEGMIEFFTKIRQALTQEVDQAVGGRLMTEECELLRLSESLASHDRDAAIQVHIEKSRAAIDALGRGLS
jgi:hypothetical protein